MFSVKSAYKVARDIEAYNSKYGKPSTSVDPQGSTYNPWKKLWSLPLPNKILHFLWRLATNSLPLRMNQLRRGMEVDTRCPVCARFDEDGSHIFLKCKMIKQIWRILQMEKIREELSICPNAKALIEAVLNMKDDDKLMICCLLWIWWAERNKANAGNKIRDSQQIVSSIVSHVQEYKNIDKKEVPQKKPKPARWSAPMANFVKINTDGAFRELTKSGGWGFIMRNDKGVPLAAGYGHNQGISSALHAEANAFIQAIRCASQLGCSRVQLETDASILNKAISSNEYDVSYLGVLFREIKALLGNAFDVIKISVCNRSCNIVAHELAALGALLGDDNQVFWVVDLPQFVNELCADNMSSTLC